MGGTAGDNVGVTQVTWANNRGGSGPASGTTAWTASGIALQPGTNVVTVTARDAANNVATATLTVGYDHGYGGADGKHNRPDGRADVHDDSYAAHGDRDGERQRGRDAGFVGE